MPCARRVRRGGLRAAGRGLGGSSEPQSPNVSERRFERRLRSGSPRRSTKALPFLGDARGVGAPPRRPGASTCLRAGLPLVGTAQLHAGMRAALASTARFARSARRRGGAVPLGKQRRGPRRRSRSTPQQAALSRHRAGASSRKGCTRRSAHRTWRSRSGSRSSRSSCRRRLPTAHFGTPAYSTSSRRRSSRDGDGLGKGVPPIVEEIRRVKQTERGADGGAGDLEPS